MKKIILIILLLFVCGCDYKELTDMSIVSVIALDKTDKFNVTLVVLDYKGINDSKEQNNIIYKSSGNTLDEAFKNFSLTTKKELYLGHVEVFIVSEYLAKSNISVIFDFLLRDSKLEKISNIVLTEDIDKVINVIKGENNNYNNLSKRIDITSTIVGSTYSTTFDDFVSKSITKRVDPILPILYVNNDLLALKPYIAIFYNNKLEAYLSSNSTIGYNILNNNKIDSVITTIIDNNYVSIDIDKVSSNMYFSNNVLYVNSKIKGVLKENNDSIDIKLINKKIKNELESVIDETLKDEIKYNSDFLGIKDLIYKNNYSFYVNNDISSFIKNMHYKINIDFELINNGSIKGDDKY